MLPSLRRSILVLSLLVGCAALPDSVDAGHRGVLSFRDSGHPAVDSGTDDASDAGEAADAGALEGDAGRDEDGGAEPDDAGVADDAGVVRDGGEPIDAGHEVDAGPVPDGGHDAGMTVLDAGPRDAGTLQAANVRGNLTWDPSELQWRGYLPGGAPSNPCENGQLADGTAVVPDGGAFPIIPPCFDADTVFMEDADRLQAGQSALQSNEVTWTGAFDIPNVNLVNTLTLYGTVTDPSGLLAHSGGLLGEAPFAVATTNVSLPVTSVEFIRHLAFYIHTPAETLIHQGVVLVHVVTTDGSSPLAGMTLMHVYGTGTNQYETYASSFGDSYVYYIGANVNGVLPNMVPSGTTSSGLIVLVNPTSGTYTANNGLTNPFEHVELFARPDTVLSVLIHKTAGL